ncbi:MAG: hypothetical protein AB7G21_00030 [Dehalococcoidia bacterium]
MTLDPSNQGGNGSGAILRALGSLIAALGADGDRAEAGEAIRAAAQPPRAPAPSPAPPPAQPAPAQSAPRASTSSPGSRTVEAEMLLADARQRAERIMQDSMERATELLNRERSAPAGAASAIEVETIRRSVDELVVGMRDVQARLARIESIISSQRVSAPAAPATPAAPPVQSAPPPAPPAAAEPPPPPAPPRPSTPPAPPARPAFSRPVEDERRPGGLSVVPERPRPASPPPPSAVPPMRGGSQPAAAHAPFRAPEPEVIESEPAAEPERPAPSSIGGAGLGATALGSAAADLWERDDADDVAGTLATFTPADGAVQLRAAPVSGFQGLMRLQDALQRIPAVRSATVEAYSQGEARLRLELAADVDSDEIAEGLGTGLGQNAVVQEASEAERSITIAFG